MNERSNDTNKKSKPRHSFSIKIKNNNVSQTYYAPAPVQCHTSLVKREPFQSHPCLYLTLAVTNKISCNRFKTKLVIILLTMVWKVQS